MILKVATLLVLATSLFLLQRAAGPIIEQNRKVRTWPAVEVRAVAKFVDAPPARQRAAAKAGIPAPRDLQLVYRYEVDGVVHRQPRFTPRTEELAPLGPLGPEVFEGGEASYTRRGHYNPVKHQELFLPNPLGFSDYWPIFFWGPVLGLGFGGLVLRKPGYSSAVAMERAEKGWYRLRPKYSIRLRASGAWGVAIVTCVVTGVAAHDYFEGEPRAHTAVSNSLVLAGLIPGLIALGLAVFYTWLAQRVGEPRVLVDSTRLTPGSRFAVKIELPTKADVDLEQVTVSLACVRSEFTGPRARFRERVIWEDAVERAIGNRRRSPAGGRVTFEQRFTVPPDAVPSLRGGFTGPWIDWEVRLRFRLDNGPDYRGKFPVTVDVDLP